jgi:hypothetical protein
MGFYTKSHRVERFLLIFIFLVSLFPFSLLVNFQTDASCLKIWFGNKKIGSFVGSSKFSRVSNNINQVK